MLRLAERDGDFAGQFEGRMLDPADFDSPELPDYAPLLAARHSAHQKELEQLIERLPLEPDDAVLDLACGDGFYTDCLARRLSDAGRVVALDADHEFLRRARGWVDPSAAESRSKSKSSLHWLRGDAYRLPFADHSFDLVWCAQSLQTLDDAPAVLREMARVTRPAGHVAILENDALHTMLLPWPPDLELAVHEAEEAAYRAQHGDARPRYVERDLQSLLPDAGLVFLKRETHPIDRQWPLPEEEQQFLALSLRGRWERIREFLDPATASRLRPRMDPDSPDFLPAQPDFTLTYLDVVFLCQKPA